jgi:YD repeat-containing protein
MHGSEVTAADPVLVCCGIYEREYTDLYVEDNIPIDFVRTQRNMDKNSRSFGIGSSTSYDMFIIGDTAFTWAALVHANGSRSTFRRVSPGNGYADAVFEDESDPSEFYGARIAWNNGAWIVKLRNGMQYIIRGCNQSMKTGQCGVIRVTNQKGDSLNIQRDPDGNIVRIRSPHHIVTITNDSQGRIIRAQDDSGKWVTYEYDPQGCLKRALNWRGDEQTFQYDRRFNMIFVHEKGRDELGPYKFSVTNRYDKDDRVVWQRVSNGQTYRNAYHTDARGRIKETVESAPSGLSHYRFNASGFLTHEDLFIGAKKQWSQDWELDPSNNAILGVTLTCGVQSFRVPLKLDESLNHMGEGSKGYVSEICRLALKLPKRKSPPPNRKIAGGRPTLPELP